MKRLLAYLFVVIGLGLVLSLNSYAAQSYIAKVINKKTYQKYIGIGTSKSSASRDAMKQCKKATKKNSNCLYEKEFDRYFKTLKPSNNNKPTGSTDMLVEWVEMPKTKKEPTNIVEELQNLKRLYDDGVFTKSQFEKAKNRLLNKEDTKIAKAEPSQTQEVATNDSFNGDYKWNGKTVSKTVFCSNAEAANMPKYYPEKYILMCKTQTQIAKAEPSQIIKTYSWFALVKHPKTNKEFIATRVSSEKEAKRIAISKCYKYVTSQLNKRGYNDCYVDLTVDGNKNIQLAKKIISKQNSNNSISLTTNDSFNGDYKWNGKTVSKTVFCSNAVAANMPKYYPEKYILMCKTQTQIATTEPKQEEFKPGTGDIDNEAPVIEIAEAITVNDSTYEIEGKVIDKSKKLFVQIDGETIPVKKGKFKIKRFSPVDEQLKIVALDQWGNKSKPKLVNITIDLKETELVEKLEQLNPSLIKSKSNKNRVALIIGIEKYEQTPAANFANLDAQYFYEYARKGFGVSKANIKLLVDEDANLVKSISTINKWLPSKIKKNKTELIIFFAGHGLASNNGEELYILPQDSDPDLLSRTALSRTELFEQIISLSPKSVTMFMDTCYSGISRDEKMLLASARPIRIVADDQEGIPDNFTIFTASKLDQISSGLEEAKHGIFSYYLMKGLEGKADSNQDKKITNGELLAYMVLNVSQKASELGRQQNPSLAGDPNKVLMSYR